MHPNACSNVCPKRCTSFRIPPLISALTGPQMSTLNATLNCGQLSSSISTQFHLSCASKVVANVLTRLATCFYLFLTSALVPPQVEPSVIILPQLLPPATHKLCHPHHNPTFCPSFYSKVCPELVSVSGCLNQRSASIAAQPIAAQSL